MTASLQNSRSEIARRPFRPSFPPIDPNVVKELRACVSGLQADKDLLAHIKVRVAGNSRPISSRVLVAQDLEALAARLEKLAEILDGEAASPAPRPD